MTENNVKQKLQYWKKLCKIYRSAAFANRELLDDVTTGVDYVQCNACGEAGLDRESIPGNLCEECGEMICPDCNEISNDIWVDKPHKCDECTKFILCSCEDICTSCREKKEKDEDKDTDKDTEENQEEDKETDKEKDKEKDNEKDNDEERAAKKRKKEDVK